MAREFVQIDPRQLRLPPTRKQGADPAKLQRQIAKHGNSTNGMPPPFVVRDKNGQLQLIDGVTRATRVAKLLPGQSITVEVIEEEPDKDYDSLPLLGDQVP